MTCDELAAHLTEFIEGTLPDGVVADAIEHLATCPACEGVLGETRSTMSAGRRYGRARLDDEQRAALLDRIAEATATPAEEFPA